MLSGDANKPTGKSGERKRNTQQAGKKAESRRRKSAQQPRPQQDQIPDAPEVVSAPVGLTENLPTDAPAVDAPLTDVSFADRSLAENSLTDTSIVNNSFADNSVATSSPAVPLAPAETVPVSYQTIANLYCHYTWQSLDHTRSFFEKFTSVRSVDKAVQLQTEFAKQAYEDFATETQKICELHGKLASQRWTRWTDFAARIINPSLNPKH